MGWRSVHFVSARSKSSTMILVRGQSKVQLLCKDVFLTVLTSKPRELLRSLNMRRGFGWRVWGIESMVTHGHTGVELKTSSMRWLLPGDKSKACWTRTFAPLGDSMNHPFVSIIIGCPSHIAITQKRQRFWKMVRLRQSSQEVTSRAFVRFATTGSCHMVIRSRP